MRSESQCLRLFPSNWRNQPFPVAGSLSSSGQMTGLRDHRLPFQSSSTRHHLQVPSRHNFGPHHALEGNMFDSPYQTHSQHPSYHTGYWGPSGTSGLGQSSVAQRFGLAATSSVQMSPTRLAYCEPLNFCFPHGRPRTTAPGGGHSWLFITW